MAAWKDFLKKASSKWIDFVKSADNPVPSFISYSVGPGGRANRQTGVEWTGYSNPYKSMGNFAVGSAKAVGEGLYRGGAGLLGGTAGLVGGVWEGAGENDRNGTGFVEGMKNLGRWAVTGATEGAKKGFTNPALLNSALESSVANLPSMAVDMAVRPFSDTAADAMQGAIAKSPVGDFQRSSNANYEGMMQREYQENGSTPEEMARAQQWKANGENMVLAAGATKALAKPFAAHPVATTATVSGVPLAVTGGKYVAKKPELDRAPQEKADNIAKTRDYIIKNPGAVDDETWSRIEEYHNSGDLSDEDYNAMNDAVGRHKSGVLYGKYSGSPHKMSDEEWASMGKYRERGFVSDEDYSKMSARREQAAAYRELLSQYPPEVVAELLKSMQGAAK